MNASTRATNAGRLRRPAWRKAVAACAELIDHGPALLEALAATAADRVPSLLRIPVDVRHQPVVRGACEQAPKWRLWQSEADRSFWCAVDFESQQLLLEFILAGPGALSPTAVERTIVAECVDRLLTRTGDDRWLELSGQSPPQILWRCDVNIIGPGAGVATLRLFTIALPEPQRACIHPSLSDVPLSFRAHFRGLGATLGDLASWRPGTILRLGGSASELEVALRLERGPVVYGTIGSVAGRRAVRLNGSAAAAL